MRTIAALALLASSVQAGCSANAVAPSRTSPPVESQSATTPSSQPTPLAAQREDVLLLRVYSPEFGYPEERTEQKRADVVLFSDGVAAANANPNTNEAPATSWPRPAKRSTLVAVPAAAIAHGSRAGTSAETLRRRRPHDTQVTLLAALWFGSENCGLSSRSAIGSEPWLAERADLQAEAANVSGSTFGPPLA